MTPKPNRLEWWKPGAPVAKPYRPNKKPPLDFIAVYANHTYTLIFKEIRFQAQSSQMALAMFREMPIPEGFEIVGVKRGFDGGDWIS